MDALLVHGINVRGEEAERTRQTIEDRHGPLSNPRGYAKNGVNESAVFEPWRLSSAEPTERTTERPVLGVDINARRGRSGSRAVAGHRGMNDRVAAKEP